MGPPDLSKVRMLRLLPWAGRSMWPREAVSVRCLYLRRLEAASRLSDAAGLSAGCRHATIALTFARGWPWSAALLAACAWAKPWPPLDRFAVEKVEHWTWEQCCDLGVQGATGANHCFRWRPGGSAME